MSVRLASIDDVDALVRLRAVMFVSMRGDDERNRWEAQCREVLAATLADGSVIAALAEVGGLAVASGVARIWQWLPSPRTTSGIRAYIGSMATDPRFRKQGHARAVFDLLLQEVWQRGVEEVELHATPDGEPLYTSAGFSSDGGGQYMRLLREGA